MRRRAPTIRAAFTFVELMIVVVVAAILTLAAWPDRDADEASALDAASDALEGDIQYARSLAILDPDDPVVLKADPATQRYWIAKASSPDTPVENPATGKPYVVQFGTAEDDMRSSLKLSADALGATNTLTFTSSGETTSATDVTVTLVGSTRAAVVTIPPRASRVVKSDVTSGVSALLSDIAGVVSGGTRSSSSNGNSGEQASDNTSQTALTGSK